MKRILHFLTLHFNRPIRFLSLSIFILASLSFIDQPSSYTIQNQEKAKATSNNEMFSDFALPSIHNIEKLNDGENATEISVLSYNVQMFGGTIANNIWKGKKSVDDSDRRKEISKRILALNSDVVGLSEVWSDDAKKDFIKLLKSRYDQYYYKGFSASNDMFTTIHRATWDKKQIGPGLIILVKKGMTIFNQKFVPFNELIGYDDDAQKGILAVSVSKGSGFFRVFLTHPQSGETSNGISARRRNIHQLFELTKTYAPNVPGFIIGDINVNANKDASKPGQGREYLNVLMSNFGPYFKDTYYELNKTSFARTASADKKRLDYILSSSANGTIRKAGIITNWTYSSSKKPCSDHLPITATVSFSIYITEPNGNQVHSEHKF